MGIGKLVRAAFLNDNASTVYIANKSIIAKYQDKPDERIGTYSGRTQWVFPADWVDPKESGNKDYYEKSIALSPSVSVKITVIGNRITNMVIMMERIRDSHDITWIDRDNRFDTPRQCHDAVISSIDGHGITLVRGRVNTGKTYVSKSIIREYMRTHPCSQVVCLGEQVEYTDQEANESVINMNPRGHDAPYMARIVLKLHPSVVIIDSNSEPAHQVLFAMIDMDGSISRRYVIQETPTHDNGTDGMSGKSRFCNEYHAVYNSSLCTMYPITTLTTLTINRSCEVHVSMNDIEHNNI